MQTPDTLGPGDFPAWLDALTTALLLLGGVCAVISLIWLVRSPPKHRIMMAVWPLTSLFAGPLALGLLAHRRRLTAAGREIDATSRTATSTTHCGAGCALGDLIAEWLAFGVPAVAVAFGWGWLFADKMFAVWVLDFLLAFLIGIAFQYATIAPMRELGVRAGFVAALKADSASIAAWQVGMFGTMALVQLALLPALFGGRASVASPEFWCAMQLAMLVGFACSFPVNALLLRRGVKEAM
ncbi:DUF4396 domain-containing protein [Schumannella luteola]|nr:DUF4396 domain-containing protein [Schumannella luteola]